VRKGDCKGIERSRTDGASHPQGIDMGEATQIQAEGIRGHSIQRKGIGWRGLGGITTTQGGGWHELENRGGGGKNRGRGGPLLVCFAGSAQKMGAAGMSLVLGNGGEGGRGGGPDGGGRKRSRGRVLDGHIQIGRGAAGGGHCFGH